MCTRTRERGAKSAARLFVGNKWLARCAAAVRKPGAAFCPLFRSHRALVPLLLLGLPGSPFSFRAATGANRFSMVNEPPSGNSLGDTKYSRIVRAYARVEKRRRRKYMRAKERRLPDRSAADGRETRNSGEKRLTL